MSDSPTEFDEIQRLFERHVTEDPPDLGDATWEAALPAVDAVVVGVTTSYLKRHGRLSKAHHATIVECVDELSTILGERASPTEKAYVERALAIARLVKNSAIVV